MQLQATTADRPWLPVLEEPGPDTGTIPGAIYDRASESGGYEYAQQTHYDLVRDLFHKHDIYVAMYRYEDRKGSKVNRQGYQDILQAARLRQIEVVGTDHMARLGRRGWERLRALEELDELRVKVYVANKGKYDEPGIVRFVEAWQDQEYLHEQARKTISNMPHVIRAGKYPAPPPIGYMRAYEFLDEQHTKVESHLVIHPEYGPLVQAVFRDYADGLPIRAIVDALHSGRFRNPKAPDGKWSYEVIHEMLRRKVYVGRVVWGRTHPGHWGRFEGMLEEDGQHEALVTPEVWDRVQARMGKQEGGRPVNQRGLTTELLDGLLRCNGCGGRTYVTYSTGRDGAHKHYTCAHRKRMKTGCAERSISARLGDDAVLAQVARLQRIPWQPQPFDDVVRRDPHEATRRRLRATIAEDEQALEDNAAAFATACDLGAEVVAAFRKNAQAITARLRRSKEQLAALPERSADTVKAKEVHDLMMQRDIPTLAANARERGDLEVVRDILVKTVAVARIVARGSRSGTGRQATWAKAEVEWTPEVQLLLDAGLLTLSEDVSTPERATRQELAKERARRYRARKREQAFPSHVEGIH